MVFHHIHCGLRRLLRSTLPAVLWVSLIGVPLRWWVGVPLRRWGSHRPHWPHWLLWIRWVWGCWPGARIRWRVLWVHREPGDAPLCSTKQPLADPVPTEEDWTGLRQQRRTCREPLSRSGAPDVTRASCAGSPESPDLPGNARGGGTKRGRCHSASPPPPLCITLGT